jgi:isocitrate/isopropylmalate dehydrogenase
MRRELDLGDLEKEREDAALDKADLFDFYNGYWDKLVTELKAHRSKRDNIEAAAEMRALKKICAWLEGFERGIDPVIIRELEEGECLKKK